MSFSSIARFFLGAALLSVIFVFTSLFFPFTSSKVIAFRFFVELAAIFFLLDVMTSHSGFFAGAWKRIMRSPIVWAVTAFVAFFILAGVFGVNPRVSWWSDFERGEGGWLMLHLYVFFLLLLFLLRTEKDWMKFFRISVAAACISLGYIVVVLLYPIYPNNLAPSVMLGGNRFGGSFGNPAYLAGYLLFIFFYLGYLWARNREKMPRLRTVLFAVLFLVFLAALLASQTRGAFVAFAAGVAVFLLYAVFSSSGSSRKWGIIALAVFVIIGGVLFSVRESPFVKRLPASRLLDIAASDRGAQARLWAWNSAWQGFKEKPLLGWGPENFLAVFDAHFDTRHFLGRGVPSETWFDRAHSVIFDYLAETGALGFLSYLSMFAAFYIVFFRAAGQPKKKSRGTKPKNRFSPERAFLFSMPVAYFVNGLFLFDIFPVYMNLFFFLAFATFILEDTFANERHA